jgi:hypothetical protein
MTEGSQTTSDELKRLYDALTTWRNEDQEDYKTLSRNEIIVLLEGLKVLAFRTDEPLKGYRYYVYDELLEKVRKRVFG